LLLLVLLGVLLLLILLLLAGGGCSGWALLLLVLLLTSVVLVLASLEAMRRVRCLLPAHGVRALQGGKERVSATAAAAFLTSQSARAAASKAARHNTMCL
jgi:hypothetical protein